MKLENIEDRNRVGAFFDWIDWRGSRAGGTTYSRLWVDVRSEAMDREADSGSSTAEKNEATGLH